MPKLQYFRRFGPVGCHLIRIHSPLSIFITHASDMFSEQDGFLTPLFQLLLLSLLGCNKPAKPFLTADLSLPRLSHVSLSPPVDTVKLVDIYDTPLGRRSCSAGDITHHTIPLANEVDG